jgi:oxygen-independent coproporphyrinogen-3 oxidase
MPPSNPLSIYVHIPFCRRRCGYCSFTSYSGREKDIPAYVSALLQEVRLRAQSGATVQTIYFGGGTPSLLPSESVGGLLKTIDEYYTLDDHVEITLEANPGTVDLKYLKSIRSLGMNRLSLGVQSLDDRELKLLGRIHTSNQAREAMQQAKEAGFNNISLDFIYGIPGRTPKRWRDMLGEMVSLGAQHLSLYALTLEEGTPMHDLVGLGEMPAPDPDASASEYELAEEVLASAGYLQYEISNWALLGYESRHNLAYWLRTPYLGLGVAAHSFLGGRRIANTSSLDEYLAYLGKGELPPQNVEAIGSDTALSEAIILGLRLNRGVGAGDIRRQFGIDLYGRFAGEIDECVSLGLLERDGDVMRLTPRGRLLGNEVFMRFLS